MTPIGLNRVLRLSQRIVVSRRLHSTTPISGSPTSQSVDIEDVRRHARLAEDWWNPKGHMRTLRAMNGVR